MADFKKIFSRKPKKPISTDIEKPKKKKKKANKNLILNIIIIFVLVGILFGGGGAFYIIYSAINSADKFDPGKIQSSNSSMIFDINGDLITNNIGKETRQLITYDELPQCVIDAFISIEDSRFFVHNGFDVPRFVRAMIENAKSLSFSQGGSTFTMQIIKFAYLMEEESGGAPKEIDRKIKEIYMAIDADSKISKKDIFVSYVNKINFGANGRGIQVASQYYFGKDVQEIGVSEAALLAGVVNLPYGYNPFLHLEDASFRRNEVLNMMEYHGYITPFECAAAKRVKVEDMLVGDDPDTFMSKTKVTPNQAYIDTVISEVIAITGDDPYIVPMRIYTAMDPVAQKVVEEVQNGKYSNVKINAHKYLDSAVIVLNHDFEIVAVGGGKDHSVQRGFNLATDMTKQSGSSMKPILSYLLAYEYLGLTTGSYVYDGPMSFPGTSTRVIDWNNRYRGVITVNTAISDSRNVPAVDLMGQVIEVIGREKAVEYMNSVGFEYVTEETFSTMDAIGGGSLVTSPLQMAGAYNMLMNLGEYVQPHTLRRIEYDDGSVFDVQYPRTRVVSDAAAYLSAHVIERNVGTCVDFKYCALKRSHPVYSKSGTTDWGSTASRQLKLPVYNGSKDKWLVTSTMDYTVSVWIGFDKGIPGAKTYYSDSMNRKNVPGQMTKVILNALEKGKPKPKGLPRPSSVGSASFIKGYTTHYAPIAGMPQEYISSGLNKAGTTSLQSYIPPDLGAISITSLSGISNYLDPVTSQRRTRVTVKVPEFFDDDLLFVQPKTRNFKYGGHNYKGNRGNDVTWWMGPVRYFAQVEDTSSHLISTIEMSDSTSITVDFLSAGYSSGSTVKACAFYAFSKMPEYRSSPACQNFQIP